VVLALLFFGNLPVLASEAEEELAREAQNPVANLISFPLQNNTNFGIGPHDRTQNVLNIQPVIPINIGNWNLINRTILPIIWQPDYASSSGGDFGLSDIDHTTFLSPVRPWGPLLWGAGPNIVLPTAVNDRLGPGKLSLGPSAVGLTMYGPWVVGALVKNLWSVAGDSDTPNVNQFLLQYFINYNLPDGWYLSSAPVITANWKADSDNRWIVPIGGGFGKVFRVGAQPMNASVQGFWNAETPDGGPATTLRLQLQLLFPR